MNTPLLEMKDILDYYKNGCKKPKDVAIGMEVEKHGIYQSDYRPSSYFGEKGLRKIQEKMVEELGWKIAKEEGGFLLDLERCGSHLTLEAAESMSELSGRTHHSIHDLARELEIHQHEESVMSKIFGVLWMGIGIQPFAHKNHIRMLGTPRYKILYQFLKQGRGLWEEDFKRTASVQANIDYTSEVDARKKFQTLLRLSPFLGAMYAHSPLVNSKLTGYASYRIYVLNHNDPDRYGIRKFFFDDDFGFEDWIGFCMDIPMVGITRGSKWLPVHRMTFRKFIKEGFEEYTPALEDWIVHTGFIYSFVRMKKYIELRICDSVPPFLVPSIQAIVKAFVYHPEGEKFLKDITKKWSFYDFRDSYDRIAKKGMDAEVKDMKILDYCKEILNVASENLHSFKNYNERKLDESVYLSPIKDFVFIKEKSPGMHVAEQWEAEWERNPERLIEWCRHD